MGFSSAPASESEASFTDFSDDYDDRPAKRPVKRVKLGSKGKRKTEIVRKLPLLEKVVKDGSCLLCIQIYLRFYQVTS